MKYRDVVTKNRGFTMVELIVVLVIVGILAAMVSPRFATSPTLDAQLQQLESDIRYTQSLALSHGARFRINLTLPSTYTITTTGGAVVTSPSTGATSVTLTSAVTMTALSNLPNNLIAFNEEGVPYTDSAGTTTALASNATITLSANGMTRSILVTPETGMVIAQ